MLIVVYFTKDNACILGDKLCVPLNVMMFFFFYSQDRIKHIDFTESQVDNQKIRAFETKSVWIYRTVRQDDQLFRGNFRQENSLHHRAFGD